MRMYLTATGFMHNKKWTVHFTQPFDALTTNGRFIEGNSGITGFVPHQPASLIKLMGGDAAFTGKTDSLFGMYLPDKYFAENEDITRDGIIGTYVHGNEPAHHVAYLA